MSTKDAWDKGDVVGKILTPLVVALLGGSFLTMMSCQEDARAELQRRLDGEALERETAAGLRKDAAQFVMALYPTLAECEEGLARSQALAAARVVTADYPAGARVLDGLESTCQAEFDRRLAELKDLEEQQRQREESRLRQLRELEAQPVISRRVFASRIGDNAEDTACIEPPSGCVFDLGTVRMEIDRDFDDGDAASVPNESDLTERTAKRICLKVVARPSRTNARAEIGGRVVANIKCGG